VSIKDKMICSKSILVDTLRQKHIEVLVTMGAGDIDRFIEPIKKIYS
jgi:UDP-N-acetylmuramate--alanine ligase